MATAAKIDILLDANTAALKKGFAETNQSINKLSSGMSGSVAKGMMKAHAAILAVTGAFKGLQGVITGTMQSIQQMAATQDMADRLGLGSTALEQLRFAAEQAGSSAGVLDTGLQRLRRRVAQVAATGKGELVPVLDKMGLSAKKLNELTSDQLALAWADGMQQITNHGDQMAAMMAGLDTEGVALINMFNQGSEALIGYGDALAETGMATEEQRKQAQKLAATVKALSSQWEQFKQVIVTYVFPILEKLLKFLGWVIEKLGKLFGMTGGTAAGEGLKPLATESVKLAAGMSNAAEKAEKIKKETVKATKAAKKFKLSAATPGVGAVTRSGMESFSAIQQQQRRWADEKRWQKEVADLLKEMVRLMGSPGLVLAPVRI